jgi:hypothetical protein
MPRTLIPTKEEELLTKAYEVAESFVGEKIPRKTHKPTTVLVLAMNITGRKFRLEE